MDCSASVAEPDCVPADAAVIPTVKLPDPEAPAAMAAVPVAVNPVDTLLNPLLLKFSE